MKTQKTYPFNFIENRPAATRCHRIGSNDNLIQLESTDKFKSLKDIHRVLSFHDAPEPTGIKSIIFVPIAHLPDELVEELRKHPNYEQFARFIDVIGFSNSVNAQTKNSMTHSSSTIDFSATIYPIPGFAVTYPVEDRAIDIKRSDSFGKQELQAFLGDKYYVSAGKLLVVNLSWKWKGNLSVVDCAQIIMSLAKNLIPA